MTVVLRLCLIPGLLLLAVPASAQEGAEDGQEIVVTGRRLDDTARALQDCLARKCPPNEDIDATLAHVENLFVAGEYKEARSIALASRKRNNRFARQFPEPVSDLNRATGRLAAHLGFEGDYYSSTWGILRALKAGIPAEDARHLGARLEIAEMMASVKGPVAAKLVYADVAKDARRIGRLDLAALADLRSAWLDYMAFPDGTAKDQLGRIAASTEPQVRSAALAARVLLARIARNEGQTGATDALITELAALNLKKPTLLFSPRWSLVAQGEPSGARHGEGRNDIGNVLARMAVDTFDDKWIDVGYFIQPDGKIADLEILRNSGETGWARPLLRSIEDRVYSPTDPAEGGFYRVERYTYTSRFEERLGTRIVQRSAQGRVEYLDLTLDAPKG